MIDCDLYNLRLSARSASTQRLEELEEISALYSGEYLEGKPYDWAVATRTQMEADFKKIQHRLADEYCALGRRDKAMEALERALVADPYDEESVMRIVNIKHQDGDLSSAIKAYRRYEKLLMEELGVLPSKKFPAVVSRQSKKGENEG